MGDAQSDSDQSTKIKDEPTLNQEEDNADGEPTVKERRAEEEDKQDNNYRSTNHVKKDYGGKTESESLYAVVSSLLFSIFFSDPNTGLASTSLLHRIRVSFRDHLPRLPEASRTSGLKLLKWARRGTPLRLLLVISVGTITLLTLTGILVFLLFLAAATINAVIVSLFISLAATGGFLAMFFASTAVIYIGVLSIAAFVISSVTISAVITAIVVTGEFVTSSALVPIVPLVELSVVVISAVDIGRPLANKIVHIVRSFPHFLVLWTGRPPDHSGFQLTLDVVLLIPWATFRYANAPEERFFQAGENDRDTY